MGKILKISQRGDTIVEVLISIAIVSLVLATAYASTNRHVGDIQDVQEHSQALKLVEAQVEYIRSQNGATLSGPTNCFDSTGSVVDTCTTSDSPNYDLNITKNGSGMYTVTADWETIHGSHANVTAYYRP